MAVFTAKIANFIGWGEVSRRYKTKKAKGRHRNTFQVRLNGHLVTIRQKTRVLSPNKNALRGKFVESSTIRVSHIKTFAEGDEFVTDLCWLLGFATQSRVIAYELEFQGKRVRRSVMGAYNSWRPPFGRGIGEITDFLSQTWPAYQQLKTTRPVAAFIHMINVSDLSGNVMEVAASFGMQCLEAVKSYYAIDEGHKHSIQEDKNGRFRYPSGKEPTFKDLMTKTLAAVGMPLPGSFDRIKKLRDALIHRGFIRETDRVASYIFGQLSPGALHRAMFEVMEEVHDLLREYMLRLLGYKGSYWSYSHEGSLPKSIK